MSDSLRPQPQPQPQLAEPGIWELLNLVRKPDPVLVRRLNLALAAAYLAIIATRSEQGLDVWIPRLAMVAYSIAGVVYAARMTWMGVRYYLLGLALILPVVTTYVTAKNGLTTGEVMLDALALLCVMVFQQTGYDIVISTILCVATMTTFAFAFPPPEIGRAVTVIVWMSSLVLGAAITLATLVARGRIELAYAALERAHAETLDAARNRLAFLAHMSHEIRTPMNGVLGMAELVLRGELGPDARRHVEVLRESAQSLLRLVNDVLDLSKIDAGKLELESVSFHPRDLLRSIVDSFRVQANAKPIELRVAVDDGVPHVLLGDPTRVRQIITNILGNAVKFTPKGYVEVRWSDAGSEGDDSLTKLVIRDTGIGMDEAQRDRIFEAFEQGDRTMSRRYGGTGLGLTITARLVEGMGGSIDVESTKGEGTTFTITLPFAIGKEENVLRSNPPDSRPSRSGRKLRILLIDDNEINRLVANELLHDLGHEVVEASGGKEGVDLAMRERFDVVLMDVEMPGLDGLQATRLIREHEQMIGARRLPILALTAHAMTSDGARFDDAGMDGVLAKPIDIATLDARLDLVSRLADRPD